MKKMHSLHEWIVFEEWYIARHDRETKMNKLVKIAKTKKTKKKSGTTRKST